MAAADLESCLADALRDVGASIVASPALDTKVEQRLQALRHRQVLRAASASILAVGLAVTGVIVLLQRAGQQPNIVTRPPTSVARFVGWRAIAHAPFTGAVAAVNIGRTVIVAFGPRQGPTVGPTARALSLVFAAFNPQNGTWSELPAPPAQLQAPFSTSLTFAWSGQVLYVTGFDQTHPVGGASGQMRVLTYDPARKTWTVLPDPPIRGLIQAAPLWTGQELLLYGSDTAGAAQGASYDPSTRSWQSIPAGPLGYRTNPVTAWSGQEFFVWGGERDLQSPQPDGAAYNPITRRWRALPASPLGYRAGSASGWSGHELIIWSGYGTGPTLEDGAAYNPNTNRWRLLPPAPIPGRAQMTSIWTGHQLLVWGGKGGTDSTQTLADGATYDTGANAWRPLPRSPLASRWGAVSANTSLGVIIVDGYGPTSPGQSSEPARNDGAIVLTR
jgi:hypothetical protein